MQRSHEAASVLTTANQHTNTSRLRPQNKSLFRRESEIAFEVRQKPQPGHVRTERLFLEVAPQHVRTDVRV